ncbi:MAG: transposase [Candidatus Methylomirabilales bacterium]
MARPLRIEYPGAIYHVLNRGTARQRVFRDARDYQRFLHGVTEVHARWGVEVFAYCLLGTHYHLCLRTPRGNLGRVMRHIDGVYTQHFNRAHGRDGPLFRGRYRAILMEAESYLSAVVRYIHRNPVAAGLEHTPEAYPWSSHYAYLAPHKAPHWLNIAQVLGAFPGPKAFHRFVLSGDEPQLEQFYARRRQQPILGEERFRAWVRRRIKALDREHPRAERRLLRPPEAAVVARVAAEYGIPPATLWEGRRGSENEPRKVAMYLVQRLCDLTLNETAARFGVRSYGAVGWACSQVRYRLDRDRRFRARIEGLEATISQQKT